MAQHSAYAFGDVTIDNLGTPARKIVADNLYYLLGRGPDRVRLRAIGNVSASHLARIRRMTSAATIDALFEIAKYFKTEAWRLLHPTMGVGLGLVPETASEELGRIADQEESTVIRDTQMGDWISMLGQVRQDWLTLENEERERWASELHDAAEATRRRQKAKAEHIVSSPTVKAFPHAPPHKHGGG
jgi:hypothetical protein